MARPIGANAHATRTRLIKAATEQFAAHGQRATSMRQVASSAGVSLATIHHYYGSKQKLFDACMRDRLSGLRQALSPLQTLFSSLAMRIEGAALSSTHLIDTIDAIVREGFRAALAHRDVIRMIMQPLVATGELDPEWRDTGLIPFFESSSQMVAASLGRKLIPTRLAIQSITTLGTRYVLCSPEELVRLVGLDAAAPSAQHEALERVEDHLVHAAQMLLLVGKP